MTIIYGTPRQLWQASCNQHIYYFCPHSKYVFKLPTFLNSGLVLLHLNNTFSYNNSDIRSYPRTAKPAWDVTRLTDCDPGTDLIFADQKSFVIFQFFLGFLIFSDILYYNITCCLLYTSPSPRDS